MSEGEKVRVKLGHGVVAVTVVKENENTLWVQLKDGSIVKRHKTKHVVKGAE